MLLAMVALRTILCNTLRPVWSPILPHLKYCSSLWDLYFYSHSILGILLCFLTSHLF
jgi:hypothetical protein